MRIPGRNWYRVLQASLQAVTCLGLGMIAFIWASIAFHLSIEHDQSVRAARQNTGNLVRAFEEQVTRTLTEVDNALLFVRTMHEADPAGFDIASVTNNVNVINDLTLRISVVGRDGFVEKSTVSPVPGWIDVSGREYFRAHSDSQDDELFISKPIVRRTDGKRVILATRRVRDANGNFAGIVSASIDPYHFARFYQSIDVGKNGLISLIGLDGIIRANAGAETDVTGRSLANTPMMRRYEKEPAGFYYSPGVLLDGGRYISYRKVADFPLLVVVSITEKEVLGAYWRNRNAYAFIATGLTVLVLIGICLGVRHRLRLDAAQAAFGAKSRELQVTLEHINQGIMMIDPDENIAVVNRRAVALLGLPQNFFKRPRKHQEMLAALWARGEFGKDGENLSPEFRHLIKSGGMTRSHNVLERVRPNGTVLEVCTLPLANGGLVLTFSDITERKQNETRIAHLARHDPLTELANRTLLREWGRLAAARLRRQREGFAVLVLDLTRFKTVNDSFGHPAGDAVLRMAADRLRQCVREIDTVARLGGDEFAVLQTNIRNPNNAAALAQRILDVVAQPYRLDEGEAVIGASIGIALAPADGESFDGLLEKADLALHRAKTEGHSTYRFFAAQMETDTQQRRALERDLRRAIEHKEFELYYQPIVSLAPGTIDGVEALMRWNHPQRGVVPPADFIPLAEETGLIADLGTWLVNQACSDAKKMPDHVKVAVNLSPVQFKGRDLVATIKAALAASGLRAHRLEVEITETVLLQETEKNLEALRELRAIGIGIALDDFGTGSSSLSYLRAFPFDAIKIDCSFVRDMEARPDCAAIVVAIAGLGRLLGVRTVAEGVETAEQLARVQAAGCSGAQGYLFGKPRPLSEIVPLLAKARHEAEVA